MLTKVTQKSPDLLTRNATHPVIMSDRWLASLRPVLSQGRCEFRDALVPGLYLRVSKTGKKVWTITKRLPTGVTRRRLGEYPTMSLAEARETARSVLLRLTQPGMDRAEIALVRVEQVAPTVGEVFNEYKTRHLSNLKSGKEIEKKIYRDLVKNNSSMPINAIKRAHVRAITQTLVDNGFPVSANRALAHLSGFFKYALQQDYIETNPAYGIRKPIKERARDRVLSEAEIRILWIASEHIGWPYGPIVRLLLLTGQRRDEVSRMSWQEIDLVQRVWTLPAHRTKNGKPHDVHLSEPAMEVLNNLPRFGPWLFSTGTHEVLQRNWSTQKCRLDQMIAAAIRSEQPASGSNLGPAVFEERWTLHDLRRTMTTHLADLDVPPHVADKILNHTSGAIGTVAAVYNRAAYSKERKAALEVWGNRLREIVIRSC